MGMILSFLGLALVAVVSQVLSSGLNTVGEVENEINNLKDCTSDKIIDLLKASLNMNLSLHFKSVLALCPEELPLTDERFRELFLITWRSRNCSKDEFLEAILDNHKCNHGHFLSIFAERLSFISPTSFRPHVTINRLKHFRKHCSADKEILETINKRLPAYIPFRVKAYISEWINILESQEPPWPYKDLLGSEAKGKIHMATVSGSFSQRCNAFVRPYEPNTLRLSGKYSLIQNETCAGVVQSDATEEIKSLILSPSKMLLMRRVKNAGKELGLGEISLGRYIMIEDRLKTTTNGHIGIWLVFLTPTEDGIRWETSTKCNSIWANDDCSNLDIPLPSNSHEQYVIVMGDRRVLGAISFSSILGLIQLGDVSSFDFSIRNIFKTIPCEANQYDRPVLMASWILMH